MASTDETSWNEGSETTRRTFLRRAGGTVAAAAALPMLPGLGSGQASAHEVAKAASGAISGNLTVWDFQYSSPGWGTALKQLDEQFTKLYPNVKIDHVGQPYNNYNALIQAAFTAHSGPDVVMFLPAGTGVLNWTQFLTPLTNMITPQMRKQITGWPVVSKGYRQSGAVYGVPIGISGNLFWYNKKLFKKAGLNPDKPPKTYAELVAYAKQLKKHGIVPFGGGDKEGYENDWWFSLLWSGIGNAQMSYALANGTLSWTSPSVVKATNDYINLVKADYFPSSYSSTPLFTGGVDGFSAGESAMFAGLSSPDAAWPTFLPALKKNLGYFQPPGVNGLKPNFLPAGAQVCWAIPSYSTNKAAAWAWIQHEISKPAAELQYKLGGVLPNLSTAALPGNAPEVVKGIVHDFRTYPNLVYPPHGLWNLKVSVAHENELNLVVGGSKTVTSALQAIESVAKDQPPA
jgi:ABC-type glycerol-3-phosphate transport system substrate-binding protein